jgi:hypothetical protein
VLLGVSLDRQTRSARSASAPICELGTSRLFANASQIAALTRRSCTRTARAASSWRAGCALGPDDPRPLLAALSAVRAELDEPLRIELSGPAGLSAGGPVPGMSLQDLVLRTAVIYDSGLPPPAGRAPITKNA